MPEINGIEFLTLLYAEPEYTNIPVISVYSPSQRSQLISVISATDELQLVYQCLKIGAADFLVKPVRVKQVEKLWQVIWRKKRDEKDKVKAQENNVKIQQAMESKITEAVSTSITVSSFRVFEVNISQAIVNYVSQLLSTCDTETKDALCNILQTLHRSNFYKSAIESYLSSNVSFFNANMTEFRLLITKQNGGFPMSYSLMLNGTFSPSSFSNRSLAPKMCKL